MTGLISTELGLGWISGLGLGSEMIIMPNGGGRVRLALIWAWI